MILNDVVVNFRENFVPLNPLSIVVLGKDNFDEFWNVKL